MVTHPRTFRPPAEIGPALQFVEALWSSRFVESLEAGPGYRPVLRELCEITGATGNALPDAHLAALAIESGAELVTHDRGFSRFPGLRWTDPIAA